MSGLSRSRSSSQRTALGLPSQALKAIGVESPARLVDSVIGAGRESTTRDGRGVGVQRPEG
jgi:hypothetical protein